MARYIDADKLAKDLDENVLNDPNCPMFIAATVDQYIGTAPTADVQEVRHSKWIGSFTSGFGFVCLKCQKPSQIKTNYCPNCGAIMDGNNIT
ncbi:MAG: hypothetical protein J1F09_01870 [Oscillospiraceae bacterium]|nr:hypothetical protein [Oscillospiraceae bacterium]